MREYETNKRIRILHHSSAGNCYSVEQRGISLSILHCNCSWASGTGEGASGAELPSPANYLHQGAALIGRKNNQPAVGSGIHDLLRYRKNLSARHPDGSGVCKKKSCMGPAAVTYVSYHGEYAS